MGAFEITATTTRDGVRVDHIAFDVPAQDGASGYLLRNRPGPARPLVVALHDSRGDRASLLPDLTVLAANGFSALAIDSATTRTAMAERDHLTALSAEIEIARAAIDAAATVDEIDVDRVALVGRGIGGEAAAAVAATTAGCRVAIAAGPLARRGRFLRSDHPAAAATRLVIGESGTEAMAARLEPLELVPSLAATPEVTWLVQMVDGDDRLGDEDRRELMFDVPHTVRLSHYDTWADLGRYHARHERTELIRRLLG